jgi:hypothetical protein
LKPPGITRILPPPELPNLAGLRAQKGQKMGLKGADMGGVQTVSNDPGTGFQYHLTVIRKTAALPALVASPPTVAVIDTGVDYTHPDLAGVNKVIKGPNYIAATMDPMDDYGHGTHVAGLIAANASNNAYGEGVSPNSKILAIKVCDSGGSCSTFNTAADMQYARLAAMPAGVPPVRVLNMSLGFGGNPAVIAQQVDALKAAGKVLVASAGNNNTTGGSWPGADPDTALRVMATEEQDCRAWFSNFSTAAANLYNIAAPGWNTPSTVPDLGFAPMPGTSMSSPIVAGAAALVWGQLPGLTRDQLVARLVCNGKLTSCGFPVAARRVDVRKAITGVAESALVGRLHDAFTGKAPSPNNSATTARLFNGGAQVALDLTNRGGFYEMTGLLAGNRILKGDRVLAPPYGSSANLKLFGTAPFPAIQAGLVNGPYTDAVPLQRAAGNATVTLDWKNLQPAQNATGCTSTIAVPGTCLGWEFDLYVKTPAGQRIGWGTGDLLNPPYVKSGRDSYDDLDSPSESVVIASQAPNGVYIVYVDKWLTDDTDPVFNQSFNGSGASVQMYNGAAALGSFYPAPPAACGVNRYWYVGRLTKTANVYGWTNVNTCSNTAP